ncbi:hypothetical protein NDU88_004800 [Pleurodeles waltl]|uniref:Uncharacterized protein n=1 Tax=Pleurodeles waltl TaxID=8319 RepID=A0AAV7UG77_PLEWA|nr:hypothetical protein NDU88_004800 [Pleurodeles waltl]
MELLASRDQEGAPPRNRRGLRRCGLDCAGTFLYLRLSSPGSISPYGRSNLAGKEGRSWQRVLEFCGPLDRGPSHSTAESPRDSGELPAPEAISLHLRGISVSVVGPCSLRPGRWRFSPGPVGARCLHCGLMHL